MQPGWMGSKFYRTCDWVWKLAYVNLLWLMFTFLGLIVFGFLPATVAMFAVIRKWLMKETDVPIFLTFIQMLKKDFLRINLLGSAFLIVGYILYFNYHYLGSIDGIMHSILALGWYIGCFIFAVTFLFIFPVYVHYDLKLSQYFKTALIVGIVNPLALLTLFISLGLALYLFYLIPGLIPFFSASMLGLLVTWCAHMSFQRTERKKEKLAS
ncbi:YesL family protein [Aquibacillus albus]|uniref:Membrane protein YesL n=1 Tax=Aquibacillus albus TaxID=1168171 RepID=A0ABS2MWP5_9BACI|nr:YesL family protein [Aquibacillus albus]MBM7570304.1 putative membrane protein YesL [Aquibacillus albus]